MSLSEPQKVGTLGVSGLGIGPSSPPRSARGLEVAITGWVVHAAGPSRIHAAVAGFTDYFFWSL